MMAIDNKTVAVTRLVMDADGDIRFENHAVVLESGDPDDPPLSKSMALPATSISFRWMSGDCALDFHRAPRRHLIILLEGRLEVVISSGESRVFTVGDLLEGGGLTDKRLTGRAVDDQPILSAFINLDNNVATEGTRPLTDTVEPKAVSYLRTYDGADGKSETERRELPYRHVGPSGYATDEIPITRFQFVLAPANLDYAWHRAPQRQFVIPITGGMEVENGQRERHKVMPGEIYVGKDVTGQGHVTRAVDGKERLSIFAHLEGSLA